MRHAKAEPTGPSDHERALARRGHEEAAEAGRWLAAQGVRPDAALVSDALRTRETWDEVAGGAGWDVVPEVSHALYVAGSDTAFDLVREVDADVVTLVLVGHNPTMAYAAELLDDGEGDQEASTAMVTRGFPTSAVSVFEVSCPWADVGPGSGRLEAFHVPQP